MDGNGITIHNENTNCNVFNAPVYNAIILSPGCQPPQAPSPAQPPQPSRRRKLLEAEAEEVRTEAPEARRTYSELEAERREAVRRALAALNEERITVRKEGCRREEPLLNRQVHWQAVYRILVDKGICREADFRGFMDYVQPLMPAHPHAQCNYDTVRAISKTDFQRSFHRWEYNGEGGSTRRTTFDRMAKVAGRFLELLETEGV